MKTVTGSIIELAEEGDFDVIIHGCNCESKMLVGLGAEIAKVYPSVKDADLSTQDIAPKDKLGTISAVAVTSVKDPSKVFLVINGYTQEKARGNRGEKLVSYDAVRKVFRLVAENFKDARIAYPKVGAGRAGGDWDTIKDIIDEELNGLDHTLVDFSGQTPKQMGVSSHGTPVTKSGLANHSAPVTNWPNSNKLP